jgi:hypothetical protein
MAVKELPLVWRLATCKYNEDVFALSEGGAVVTKTDGDDYSPTLVTSGVEFTTGKHYWEVEILNDGPGDFFVGVTRPNLNPYGDYAVSASTDGWFTATWHGGLYGNGKLGNDPAGDIEEGDRVGVLLDLDEGSLRFFKNDVQGPGYPAGSVTGPVVCAVQLDGSGTSARLLPQDTDHALLQ